MGNRILILILLVFGLTSAFSQRQNIRFEHLSTEAGLSQSNVLCILQDSRGFMWFGTRDGLNKYDGHKFTVYKNNAEDENTPSNDEIMDLKEDSDGNLWIATYGGGLNMFDWKKEKFTRYRHTATDSSGIPTDYLHSLYIDHEGSIWVGTSRAGLSMYDKKTNKFTTYQHEPADPNTISGNSITGIIEDDNDNLWVGTINEGINLFDKKSKIFRRFFDQKNTNTPVPMQVETLYMDRKGQLWIPTREGLYLYDRKHEKFRHFKNEPANPNSIGGNVVLSIEEDDTGIFWIGTENGGLSLYNQDTEIFVNYKQDDVDGWSLNNNSIWSIYRDVKGNMWVGTFSGGINFVNRDAINFVHYRHTSSPLSLSNNSVWAIIEDSRKNIWIGTDGGGLNMFDAQRGAFTSYKHEGSSNSICGNHVLSLAEDGKGNLWIGTWGNGITVFNKEKRTFKHFRYNRDDPSGISTPNIWTIYKDSDNNMWVGTYSGGADRYDMDNDNFIHYRYDDTDPSSLGSNTINVFFEDSKKNLWVGTHGGLSLFDKDKKSFTNFRHSDTTNSISNNRVYCISEERGGNLWIGTEIGLNYFDRKANRFTHYYINDGLPGNRVFAILSDKKGNLWISTNNGITRFDITSKTFKNFGVADGLQGREFKKGAWKSVSGKLYFGGVYGFNEFFPEHIEESRYEPPLVITGFEIFNHEVPISKENIKSPLAQSITATQEILLSYDQSVISFEFASLNYLRNRKQYVYKLEGFDKTWNYIGSKHSATYTNLDAGKYTFRVSTLDDTGNVSKNTIDLRLRITPPYWETWWFRTFLAMVITGSAFSYYLHRVNTIKARQIELEIQVKERTHQLSEANSALTEQKQELAKQAEELEELYREVKDSIKAAQIIQHSILPTENSLTKYLPQSFILNIPKDEVSGDFYWFNVRNEQIIIAAADCTGHGVSGALMAINGHHLLNQTVYHSNCATAATMLNNLNEGIIRELHHEDHETMIQNGMDIALCVIDKEKKSLQYAGSVLPLYILRNNEIIQIKGNPFSLGLMINGKTNTYEHTDVSLQKGDTIYLFSDGYADQLGGETGMDKFLYQRFRKLLVEIGHEDMIKQKKLLEETIIRWRNGREQIDDILIVAFRV